MSQLIEHKEHWAREGLRNPLMKGLACAALSSGLRSLLIFDASSTTLQKMSGLLAQMIAVLTEGKALSLQESESKVENQIVTVQLGAVETEEELWGSLSLSQEVNAQKVIWEPGLLASGRGRETRIVVIPDLSRLSLAASRACVMLIGADVAHLERHGQHDRWQPKLYWLAGCDLTRIGTLSPHLLDRFALRLNEGESQNSEQRLAQLRAWMERLEQEPFLSEKGPTTLNVLEVDAPRLSPEITSCLQQMKHSHPDVLPRARERVLDYLEKTEGYSPRRALALLRLARVHAQLERAAQVSQEDVDLAAAMIGLSIKPNRAEKPISDPVKSDLEVDEAQSQPARSKLQPDVPEREMTPPLSPREPVFEPDTTKTLPSTSLPIDKTINPYPEDGAIPEREAESLRLPSRRFKSTTLGRGAVIGVEPATTPQDLALVSTLLESAKYQKLRWNALKERKEFPEWLQQLLLKQSKNGHNSLILQPTDLRRYRRAVIPEKMLVLVMDYTCLRDCQWQLALLPYLQWAYVERASLCLVQVGAVSAAQELQAEKIVAQNVLVPRISNGLELGGGQATPLAHGLDLALQTLRHALQHGRSAVRQAALVVVSDGRGNVPLKASQLNQKPEKPVNRQGIEDALQVARQISTLQQVKVVVLNPQPKYYIDLPVKLAQALGAKIAVIPSLKGWEVDEE
ncbi:MAG: hypothetical protein AAGE59_26500 [Cyanobacteria bacterium P01_F01_bin.86]